MDANRDLQFLTIHNPSKDSFARNVSITFSFKRTEHPIFNYGSIHTDPTCKEHNTELQLTTASFLCDTITPMSTLTFIWFRNLGTILGHVEPADRITITIAYEGYTFTRHYTRCFTNNNPEGGTYVESIGCSR